MTVFAIYILFFIVAWVAARALKPSPLAMKVL
jgi:hypothetical protein